MFSLIRCTLFALTGKSKSIRKMSAKCEIELRSDTFTTPDRDMRKAMAEAVVGDDVYKEDPTVNELERRAAQLMDKQAALFVPTGTMGNLIAVMVHCDRRGMEVLLGDQSHIFLFEQGGVAQVGGIHSRTLTTQPDGAFDLDEIRRKVRPRNMHNPITGLICVENTHLRTGGQPLPLDFMDQIGALKSELNLPLHMDGARIMNAAVYHGVTPSKIAQHCDSLCFCLSKAS
uniref:Aromatic amino acid beta-eliminating lyase/threonine aldolase domain-containing protein n=1 Tax=Strigamia maritima TaxID=126957 RepID=T1J1U7_STRMM